jgi:hypothetical protein
MIRSQLFSGLAIACAAVAQTLPAQARRAVDPKPVTIVTEHQLHGSSSLHNISFAIPAASDRFIIADSHSGQLVFIDEAARVVKVVGRAGDGPGEFRHIASIGGCGTDSVYVWDKVRRKVSVVDPRGTYIREFSLGSEARPDATDEVVCSGGGTFAYAASPSPGSMKRSADGVARGFSRVRVTDNTGKVVLTLDDSVPSTEYVVLRGGAGPRPLGKKTQLALIQNQLAVITGDSTEVSFISLRDQTRRSLSVSGLSSTISPGDFEEAVDDLLAMVQPAIAQAVRPGLINVGPPAAAPGIRSILRGDDGFFWIAGASPAGATRMQSMDATGKVVATIEIPGRFTPTSVSPEGILGIAESPDGDRALQFYRIRR